MSKKSFGFSLIEIMVAIAIVAVLATMIVPNFRGRSPKYEREKFIANVNRLMQGVRANALKTHKMHRVYIDLAKKTITAGAATDTKDNKGLPVFKALTKELPVSNVSIPDNLQVMNFYIEGMDVITNQEKEMWFFVMPEGVAQSVIINMLDSKDRIGGRQKRQTGLVLNPFNAQFKTYDTFQKP